MDCREVIEKLGYSDNPAFLQDERLGEHYGYSYFFSLAQKEDHCNLKGVYTLLGPSENSDTTLLTPVVYVCEATNEDQARKIHKRVWNQNIVPFLFVITPQNVRLYSGFDYDEKEDDEKQILQVAKNVKEILDRFPEFTADAIDSGWIWERQKIPTANRVDRHLLANLEKLSGVLNGSGYDLSLEHAHILIGKYIYLKYLRDRDILSDDRLLKFNMAAGDFLGRNAQKNKLYEIEEYLDIFLNGSVFPLPPERTLRKEHIQKVAGTFQGDDPEGGQQVLFNMYDFSCIPIETLSVVYQQFLRQKGQTKEKGAYYTPVHLVNFILDELSAKKPLKKGMKVFDPSCGSGAFLVQCYRRLVESILRGKKEKLNPSDLRGLLTEHIFGLDADEEACQVAHLSLSLTLLDYIDPPDLTTHHNFRLPDLRESNIFYCEGGFFDEDSPWARSIRMKKEETKYGWIVGNPPWKNIDKKKDDKLYDKKAIEWINANKNLYPVDNYQLAEAFVWKVTTLLDEKGQCGFLMPAKTLFKKRGKGFRNKFFSEIEAWRIVNFSNIRRYLFEGAINPAAVFFFSGRKNWSKADHYITTYAPFAVEQSSQLNQKGGPKKLWSVFVNYPSIKELPLKDITSGSSTPWKIAMWGTQRDNLLLRKIAQNFPTFEKFMQQQNLFQSEGLQIRLSEESGDKIELANEIKGKKQLLMEKLKGINNIHHFPDKVFERLPVSGDIYVRKGRKELPLKVCQPPHVFIDAARRFTIYSDEFFIIPPRQIGISGAEKNLLKALALYLKSEFVTYQQWLTSASWGIERDNSNFDDLKKLPVPLAKLSDTQLSEWAKLHDEIVEADKKILASRNNVDNLWGTPTNDAVTNQNSPTSKLDKLLKQMNEKVYQLLGINDRQHWLIEDMLNVRIKLNNGNIAKEAISQATEDEIKSFARIFQEELDLFFDETGKKKTHKIKVPYTDNTAVMIIEHLQSHEEEEPEILEVKNDKTEQIFDRLKTTQHKGQWIYYNRCLKIYEGRKTYIFKPRQRLYWLKSQALVEADDFLAEKIGGE
jgi:hypothetical protein